MTCDLTRILLFSYEREYMQGCRDVMSVLIAGLRVVAVHPGTYPGHDMGTDHALFLTSPRAESTAFMYAGARGFAREGSVPTNATQARNKIRALT